MEEFPMSATRRSIKQGAPAYEELEELGQKITGDWRKLGRRLGINDETLQEIHQAHDELSEKGYQMLKHWRQKQGSGATYQALCDALQHHLVLRQDLAEQFCYIKDGTFKVQLPVGPVPEEIEKEEAHGATAGTCGTSVAALREDQEDSSRVRGGQKQKMLEPDDERGTFEIQLPADPVPKGIEAEEIFGATAGTCGTSVALKKDQEDSSIVRGGLKRKISEPADHGRALKIRIDVDTMKPAAEVLQETHSIPTTKEVLRLFASKYLQSKPLESINDFFAYLERLELTITDVGEGSLVITVKCDSLEALEKLWEDYTSDHLGEVVQRYFVTDEILIELSLAELKLKTTILEEEYKACKLYFEKESARDQCESAVGPEEEPTYFTEKKVSNETDDKVNLETQTDDGKLATETDKDDPPSDIEVQQRAPTFEELEELGKITGDWKKLRRRPGIDNETLQEEYRARDEWSEKRYHQALRDTLNRIAGLCQDSAETFSYNKDGWSSKPSSYSGWSSKPSSYSGISSSSFGWSSKRSYDSGISFSSSSRWPSEGSYDLGISSSLSSHAYAKVLRPVLPRDKMHQIARSGLQKFDVSSPQGLQDYMSYLNDNMCNAGQEGSSTNKITEGMDNDEFKYLVSIHVEEDKWQVVVVLLNELLDRKGASLWATVSVCKTEGWETDEDAESDDSESRTLAWWPTEVDKDLITLCKVLTEGDCRLNRLQLKDYKVTDEGVKHLAEALKHSTCSLKSLDLRGNDAITDEGVKHLADALKHSTCSLKSLDLSWNDAITDEGVKHLTEALKHSNCSLNSLNHSWNNAITDEGVKHLAEALKHSNCSLKSLDLSKNKAITDEGVKHLAEALKHSNCSLKSLNLSWNRAITDEGVKHLAEALKHSNCLFKSLDLTWNYAITDKGVKHLAEALKHSNCSLKSLDLSWNDSITDEGVKHLAEALTHSNCSLNSLHLRGNDKITDKGVHHLAEALFHSNYQLSKKLRFNIEVIAKDKRHASGESSSRVKRS